MWLINGTTGWRLPTPVDADASGNYQPDFGLQNTGPFSNVQSLNYWSGVAYAPFSYHALGPRHASNSPGSSFLIHHGPL